LTPLFLLLALPALCVDGFHIKTSVLGVLSDPSGWMLQNRMGWERAISADLSLALDSDLRWTDHYLENDPQKAWHSGNAALKWHNGPFTVKAAYRNTFYGSSAQAQLFPQWNPLTEYKKSLQHQSAVAADWDETIDVYAMHKHLRATPYTFDFGTWQFVEGQEDGLDDVYAGIGAAWKPSQHLKLLLGTEYKDGNFATDGQYQITTLTAGAETNYSLSYGSRVDGSLRVEHREGDFADTQRANVLRTRIRVQKRIINDLAAMLVWENNACFDNGFSALRLISNYLRAQAVFNLGYDAEAASFLSGGFKYSPENEATAVFGETDCLIGFHTYAGAGAQWIPERQSTLRASLTHRFMKNQDVRLSYTRVNNLETPSHTDYLGISTGFWW